MQQLRLLAVALSLSVLAASFATAGVEGRSLEAVLSGDEEVPIPGPGSGFATIELNQGQGTVSFEILVFDVDPPSAAHIHLGAAGVAGPVVVNFNPTFVATEEGGFFASGVVENVDPQLIQDIRHDPSAYYVNVHTTLFPMGAARGQLSK